MYAFIKGVLHSLEDDHAIILVEWTGFGLEVSLSPKALGKFLIGEWCAFPIYHHRTEVSEMLFGFESESEKRIFQKLLRVNGVGGKTALAILGLGIEGILGAIERHEDGFLASVPWIGKKTAQKIIVELAGSLDLKSLKPWDTKTPATNRELIASLVQMGYERWRVERVVADLDIHLTLEEKTIESVRKLAQR